MSYQNNGPYSLTTLSQIIASPFAFILGYTAKLLMAFPYDLKITLRTAQFLQFFGFRVTISSSMSNHQLTPHKFQNRFKKVRPREKNKCQQRNTSLASINFIEHHLKFS